MMPSPFGEKRTAIYLAIISMKNISTIFFLAILVTTSFIAFSPTIASPYLNSKIPYKAIEYTKAMAADDVRFGTGRRTNQAVELALKQWPTVNPIDIRRIYDEEYTRSERVNADNPFYNLIVLGLVFILGMALKEAIKKWTMTLFGAIGNWIYSKCAGTRIFRGIALRRYRQALTEKFQKLKIPFRPHLPLEMRKVYVPLKVAETTSHVSIDAYQALSQFPRLMVKGPPGSGKSMLMRHIALSYAEGRPDQPVPVLLELHRLSSSGLTVSRLEQYLVEVFDREGFPKAGKFVSQNLKRGMLMLLLDGLDEVSSALRSQAVQGIKDLLEKYKSLRAIITCRSAVYHNEFVETVDQTLEIMEFNDQQIRRFLNAWKTDIPPDKSIETLLQNLHDQPKIMSLARNPLLLTIIAYLYTDTPFVLPHSRADFYQMSTDILLGLRDEQRRIPNTYTVSDKRRVLQNLALQFQKGVSFELHDRRCIDRETVFEKIKEILPSLNLRPDTDTRPIINEIVERSGLLLRIDGGEGYQFTHQTLQEFFAAAALKERSDELIKLFQADRLAWREPIKLWCGIAGDSTAMIREVYREDPITSFECLADVKEVDQTLAESIITRFQDEMGAMAEPEGLAQAFGAVAADPRPRGKTVLEFLKAVLADDSNPARQSTAAIALSMTNLNSDSEILAQIYHEKKFIQAREGLIRMGDIAITQYMMLAKKGHVEMLDDLRQIETPAAARALSDLMWHANSDLATHAALNLAALLPQQDVEDELRTYKLTVQQRKSELIDWVWEPFSEGKKTALAVIAGRMAYLISTASIDQISQPVPPLDPRIIIPILSIQWHEEAYKPAKWGSEADALLQQKGKDPQLEKQMAQEVKRLLNKAPSHSRWRLLLSAFHPRMQLDLLFRLVQFQTPTPVDWRNLFLNVTYEFRTKFHYRTVLAVAFLMSLATVFDIGLRVVKHPQNWINGLLGIVFFVQALFWMCLSKGIKDRWEPDKFVRLGLKGPLTYYLELRRVLMRQTAWPWIKDESALILVIALVIAMAWAETEARIEAGAVAWTVVGAVAVVVAVSSVWYVTGSVAVVEAGAMAWAVVVAVAVAWAGAVVEAGAWAGILAVAVAWGAARAGAMALALAVAVAVAWAWKVGLARAEAGAVAVGALLGLGLGVWLRGIIRKPNPLRFLAVFAFPLFCWFPITIYFSTHFLGRFFSWSLVVLIWLLIGIVCTILWTRGQNLDRKARNPLRGILKSVNW